MTFEPLFFHKQKFNLNNTTIQKISVKQQNFRVNKITLPDYNNFRKKHYILRDLFNKTDLVSFNNVFNTPSKQLIHKNPEEIFSPIKKKKYYQPSRKRLAEVLNQLQVPLRKPIPLRVIKKRTLIKTNLSLPQLSSDLEQTIEPLQLSTIQSPPILPEKKMQMHLMPVIEVISSFHQKVRKSLQKLKKLKKITLQDIKTNRVFSTKPFEKQNSKEFIGFIKKNDFSNARMLLESNPYLTFDFDFLSLTSLHWACKKGHIQSVQLLLTYDCDIDGEDIVGRTPLYLAFENGHNEIAKVDKCFYIIEPLHGRLIELIMQIYTLGIHKYDHCFHQVEKYDFQKLKYQLQIDILLRLTPKEQRQTIWIKQAISFYVKVDRMYDY